MKTTLLLLITTLVTVSANADVRRALPPLQYFDSSDLNHSLGFRVGTPTSKQNVPINTKEVYLRKEYSNLNIGLLTPSLEIAVAQLNADELKGYNYSIGPSMAIPLGGLGTKLQLIGSGKVHWLTRHDYGRKRYGGPVQWTYNFGVKYQMLGNTYAEYTWSHMSNGDRYEFNPALETHNFSMGVNF